VAACATLGPDAERLLAKGRGLPADERIERVLALAERPPSTLDDVGPSGAG
jgi:hypothetical protein